MFCSFCKLVTKIAVDLIGIFKVNFSVSKNGLPIELWGFIQTIHLNTFRLMSIIFLIVCKYVLKVYVISFHWIFPTSVRNIPSFLFKTSC